MESIEGETWKSRALDLSGAGGAGDGGFLGDPRLGPTGAPSEPQPPQDEAKGLGRHAGGRVHADTFLLQVGKQGSDLAQFSFAEGPWRALASSPFSGSFWCTWGCSHPMGTCMFCCCCANYVSGGSQGMRVRVNPTARQTALDRSLVSAPNNKGRAGAGPTCHTCDFSVSFALIPIEFTHRCGRSIFVLFSPMTSTCKNFSLYHPVLVSLYFKSAYILCQVDV